MSALVLDCSIAVSWCFEDEASEATDQLLLKVQEQGALVPALWYLEFGNVLIQAKKKGRISEIQLMAGMDLIRQLPISTDPISPNKTMNVIMLLAIEHGLTTYDASYLELALRFNISLLTKDAHLRKAANKLGIQVLP
mgnify:CR=1 FL=1